MIGGLLKTKKRRRKGGAKEFLSFFLALLTAASMWSVLPGSALSAGAADLPAAVDLTETIHLPPIGNQGGVGCCVSMAATYMQFTNAYSRYIHREFPGIMWEPSSGDPAFCFSPRFTYNLGGAGTDWVYHILEEQGTVPQTYGAYSGGVTGAASEDTLAKDFNAYEGIWRIAQTCRIKTFDQVWAIENRSVGGNTVGQFYFGASTGEGAALIRRIKESLNAGNVVVTGGYPDRWVTDLVEISGTGTCGKTGDRAIPYSTNVSSGGHQVSIVGYDDEITCVKNGATLKGAFKIANSWGDGWVNDGFVWMMYDALGGYGQSAHSALNVEERIWTMDQFVFLDWQTDMKIGVPELIAELTLSASDRDAFSVTLTRTDRETGANRTFTPYMFTGAGHRAYHDRGLSFGGTADGKGTTGTLAFNFDPLVENIPRGRSTDDYVWKLRIRNTKDDAQITIDKVTLYKKGAVIGMLADLNTAVTSGELTFTPDPEQSGTFENGGWMLQDGTLTVYGYGALAGYPAYGERPWSDALQYAQKIVVDEGITAVGANAFTGCLSVQKIVCGKGVTSVGEGAFADCAQLEEIVFSSPVEYIGTHAIDGSRNLKKVTLTDQTSEDFLAAGKGAAAFTGIGFHEILPPPPEVVEGQWSGGVWTLTEGVLCVSGSGPIDDFRGSEDERPWADVAGSITKIVIDDGITRVGKNAFSRLGNLREVVCGKDVSSLGFDCFAYNGTLKMIVFEGALRTIEQGAVYSTGLKYIVLDAMTEDELDLLAKRAPYCDALVNAEVLDEAVLPVEKMTTVYIFGSGLENRESTDPANNGEKVTQILFAPSDWKGSFYRAGMPVTVTMKAQNGEARTFRAEVSSVYDGGAWGVCMVEFSPFDALFAPQKDELYTASFAFAAASGEYVTETVDRDYRIVEEPSYGTANPAMRCDFDEDGEVSITDVGALLDAIDAAAAQCGGKSADIDRDGRVCVIDVTALLNFLSVMR